MGTLDKFYYNIAKIFFTLTFRARESLGGSLAGRTNSLVHPKT